MFDGIGAREHGLLWIMLQYWRVRSHVGEAREWAKNYWKGPSRTRME